jgi:hypothetical protein
MNFCFQVRFRTSRPIDTDADRLETEIKPAAFTRPLRFSRALVGTARDENWLTIDSCCYPTNQEARAAGTQVQNFLLMVAPKYDVGIEFTARGSVPDVNIYPKGQLDTVDPGAPMPVPLKATQLTEIVTDAMQGGSVLRPNQRVAAELLNDSFFNMPPEARFLLRIAAVEALCPQARQPQSVSNLVDTLLAAIPPEAPQRDRDQFEQTLKRLAKQQTVRRAFMSKITQLLGADKARQFDGLYAKRSTFLHDGAGRGTLGQAADAAFALCWKLLIADIRYTPGDGETRIQKLIFEYGLTIAATKEIEDAKAYLVRLLQINTSQQPGILPDADQWTKLNIEQKREQLTAWIRAQALLS